MRATCRPQQSEGHSKYQLDTKIAPKETAVELAEVTDTKARGLCTSVGSCPSVYEPVCHLLIGVWAVFDRLLQLQVVRTHSGVTACEEES